MLGFVVSGGLWPVEFFSALRDGYAMKIQVPAGALKDTKWHEYAVRFFFGGLVTVMAGVLANKFGPALGGLFLAFPAIFPAGATLIEKHEKEKKVRAGFRPGRRGKDAVALDAAGTTIGGIGLIVFAILAAILLPHNTSPVVVLVFCALVWITASVTIWRLSEYL